MKIRSLSIFNVLASMVALAATVSTTTCHAQSAVLTDIYGRGVHAFNAGQFDRASEWLNMAIDNGYRDPRAYYFLGLSAAASGRQSDAESDFQKGAEIEASGAFGNSVGQALSRVQGPTRLALEQIREKARLTALAKGNARSTARYGEIGGSAPLSGAAPLSGVAPLSGAAPQSTPAPANAAAAPPARPRAVMAPVVPTGDDPFSDDMDQDPVIESNDVLEGVAGKAVPTDSEAAPAAAPAGEGSPFDAGGGDPFANPAGGAPDPFGTGGGDDPFN